jgi:hypothetical protein
MGKLKELDGYELKALIYAEKYGIIDYKLEGSTIIWEEFYRNEGRVLHTEDLETGLASSEMIEKPYWQK